MYKYLLLALICIIFKSALAQTVTGTGDQPQLAALTDIDLSRFQEHAAPIKIIAAINKQYKSNIVLLDKYIAKYKPSTTFIRDARINQKYFAAMAFYNVKVDPSVTRTGSKARWQHIQDSLFSVVKLSNDAALTGSNYIDLIKTFCLREKEHLWTAEDEQPKAFYRQWYNTTPDKGKDIFAMDRGGMLVAKLIDKHFNGKVREFLYADLLKNMLSESNLQNLPTVFNRFKQLYPNSGYIAQFNAPVAKVVKQLSQPLNANMIFPPYNGSKLNSMADLLKLVKGKAILIDMWGTWCSPCREEIEAHAQALHDHFKGKPATFVYVSNYDSGQEARWKKLIAFYHLEGIHILANQKLTDDIMNRTNSSGYPTYIIVKKNGSYARARTQHPVDRQAMISELTAAAK
ncbi:TlpA family protein disulfide reductase [Mucilaginibacter myungsuensis]|uniref:TlpA family protein disulfide reductase n=1 Tax=Mucilaginibacter myungsuensis TaxID=649104 RepID=A0A929PXU5_9SPHI|nr:TlpA disulfide reductase family protein [Mucilaginibacter myungsuensis]MBE9663499.1 TlpA family protein disulfide reductase [Mucilaginibacter myungsuensis]MDN3600237.1 TlpA disulfide reductase family protein [Mucilaginibacter myungsuensis]